jgi:RND family efflux transporter MFP subunit
LSWIKRENELMVQTYGRKFIFYATLVASFSLSLMSALLHGQDTGTKPQGPPPVPVHVAPVIQDTVSEQITLVGTTEAIARSMVAAEVSGLVEDFPVREGDFVKKGEVLVRLNATDVLIRLKAAIAAKERVRANLIFAEKELARYRQLKDTDSIAARKYDEALYSQQSLEQELLGAEAQIDLLKDEIQKKTVRAPFAGYVAKEHTQVGEWLSVGGPREVVTLVDLGHIRITVDVPERYVVKLSPGSAVRVEVESLPDKTMIGKIAAILPEADPNARTFPVRVTLPNPGFKIKSGMEVRAAFDLGTKKNALLVPKDAIVTAGANRVVFLVMSTVVQPVPVTVTGYYDGNVAVEGAITPGDRVVIRGNERLRPGQPVQVLE